MYLACACQHFFLFIKLCIKVAVADNSFSDALDFAMKAFLCRTDSHCTPHISMNYPSFILFAAFALRVCVHVPVSVGLRYSYTIVVNLSFSASKYASKNGILLLILFSIVNLRPVPCSILALIS